MLQANYHTHSRWCNHAVGEIEDYLEKAISLGFKEIALTDHVPHKEGFSWIPFDQLGQYNIAIDEAIAKYQDRIRIFKGFECEHILSEVDYYKRLIEEYGYTFLIQGQHLAGKNCEVNAFNCHEEDEILIYADSVCEGIASGFYKLLAHPDVVYSSYKGPWSPKQERAFHQIFACCEEYHQPVEINASGLRGDRGYPRQEVFSIAKQYDLRFLINSDAHDPAWLYDDITMKAEQFAQDLDLPISPLL